MEHRAHRKTMKIVENRNQLTKNRRNISNQKVLKNRLFRRRRKHLQLLIKR